jgi:hypothetical protein
VSWELARTLQAPGCPHKTPASLPIVAAAGPRSAHGPAPCSVATAPSAVPPTPMPPATRTVSSATTPVQRTCTSGRAGGDTVWGVLDQDFSLRPNGSMGGRVVPAERIQRHRRAPSTRHAVARSRAMAGGSASTIARSCRPASASTTGSRASGGWSGTSLSPASPPAAVPVRWPAPAR